MEGEIMKKESIAKVVFMGFCLFALMIVLFNTVMYLRHGNRENINNTETKKFTSSIIKTDKNIQKAKIYTQNAAFQFDYTVKNQPTKDELATIFNKSYDFLMTNDKCRDLVLGFYKEVAINIYYKEDWYLYEGRNFVDSKTNIANGNEENNWISYKNGVVMEKFTKGNNFQK
jgi:hypothetical protein